MNPTLKTTPSPSCSLSSFTKLTKSSKTGPKRTQFYIKKTRLSLKSLKCISNSDPNLGVQSKSNAQNPEFVVSCSMTTIDAPLETSTGVVSDKLQRLVSEFGSLTEPIDRVKRLLRYAAVLPPFDESARLPANRVTGCTTQVWLDAKIEEYGRMRFRADSDSEITKGFCSCLIWMLDGAEPEEVLRVRLEDLTEMNVGVHGKAQSRVNTWYNVLIGMQKRTKALVAEREVMPPLSPFPSLVVTVNGISANGSYAEAPVLDPLFLVNFDKNNTSLHKF